MTELKPCPICGDTRINIEEAKDGLLYGAGVGCLNINCDHIVIRYALTQSKARKLAIEAWNSRAE